MKETTIIYRDGSSVGLGVLEETGRKFYHVRFVKDAFQGGIELSDKLSEIPMEDVEILDGYDYQALIDFQDRSRAVLLWRGSRQIEINTVRQKAMAAVETKVTRDMKAWDKSNPEPRLPVGAAIIDEAPAATEEHERAPEPTEPDDPINTDEDPICGCLELAEKGHDPACQFYLAPPEEGLGQTADLCTSTFQKYPCDLPNDHEGKHEVKVDDVPWTWDDDQSDEPDEPDEPDSPPKQQQEPITDFQRPADPPTPEEAQETAPSGDKCKSMKGDYLCVLPVEHDEMHSNTVDPTDGVAPRWNDEEQDGEMPF